MSGIELAAGSANRNSGTLPGANLLSFGAWFRITAYHTAVFPNAMVGTLSTSFQGESASMASDDELVLTSIGGTSPTGFTPALNTWYYLGLVIADGDQRLYVWDESAAQLASVSRADNLATLDPIGTLTAGANGDGTVVMWNSRVWEAALTEGQFISERDSATPVLTTDLWSVYPYLAGDLLDDSEAGGYNLNGSYNYAAWAGVEPVLPGGGSSQNAAFFGANS